MSAAPGRDKHARHMRLALELARRGYGLTSPNPMVGAVLVRGGKVIGRGWHHYAGGPHAEIEAFLDASRRKQNYRGADLYVTLEPCSTYGRTPPCTSAIIESGIRQVIIGAIDPNPAHGGKGIGILKRAGVRVIGGVLADQCESLNESFNHWIVRGRPFVTVKAAMSLDGRIASVSGESKWITGPEARGVGMKLRQGADAILVGINTILADDPSLTFRGPEQAVKNARIGKGPALAGISTKLQPNNPVGASCPGKIRPLRRIILDSRGRTPMTAKVVNDSLAAHTTIVLTRAVPTRKRATLEKRCQVLLAPSRRGKIDLPWLLNELGKQEIASLLVEGGGEVNASFLMSGLAQRIAFFYAPKILGGRDGYPGVAGQGIAKLADALRMDQVEWQQLGPDLFLTARLTEDSKRVK